MHTQAADTVPEQNSHTRGDYAAAVVPVRKAAEQGDAKAQIHLGDLYADGRGVYQSYAQAIKWYCKALILGYAPARRRLEDYGIGGKQRVTGSVSAETRCRESESSSRPVVINVFFSATPSRTGGVTAEADGIILDVYPANIPESRYRIIPVRPLHHSQLKHRPGLRAPTSMRGVRVRPNRLAK
jgi:hypothetical protein